MLAYGTYIVMAFHNYFILVFFLRFILIVYYNIFFPAITYHSSTYAHV